MSRDDLTFGWFLPTSGDTTCLGDPAARIAQSPEVFDEIVEAVDNGGFKYLLMPVNATCWEATVVASYYAARTRNVAPLIAIRSGYCNPTLVAKMFATLDQMSGGRLCINLIAGISDEDTRADGILDTKEVRYEKMDEEVEIMKKLWAAPGAIDHQGKHTPSSSHRNRAASTTLPPFFLGGGRITPWRFRQTSTVHLFWGDKPAVIEKIEDIRERLKQRRDEIQFGMRLQIICRDTEEAAWEEAYRLIAGSTKFNLANNRLGANAVEGIRKTSEANRRVWDLLEESGEEMKIHTQLWTGISTVRAGAGIAVVGTPKQVAEH